MCRGGFAQNAASPNLRFLINNWLEIQLQILLASDRGEAGSAGAGCFSTREVAWNLFDFVVYPVGCLRGGGKFPVVVSDSVCRRGENQRDALTNSCA